MKTARPLTIRLHLWLELDGDLSFGLGRALLLEKIAECGSLKKAALELGISYRAAWGKIKKSEEMLGFELITRNGCKREGCRLTEEGKQMTEEFLSWFEEVEQAALKKADEFFSRPVMSYRDAKKE